MNETPSTDLTAENDAPWSYEIEPGTESYYDRMTLDAALADTKTQIEEWSYADDPHGYCHFRPMLVRLVEAIEATRVTSPGAVPEARS